ncbi:MAG: hypothetical protein B7Y40_04970 [Gammaproteobacteria bacterium 28-57-27]|nr:MAG: hypothetical protein B7Y40_04970 [Gammaproteobacteria bacterium 28-57-27]
MSKRMALLITRATPEAAYAPWMMAATAAAMGFECKLFYAFSGLDLLREQPLIHGQLHGEINVLPGAMPEPLALRSMCIESGVSLVACSASLAAQGLTQNDVVAGVELAGMASWLAFAAGAEVQLSFA